MNKESIAAVREAMTHELKCHPEPFQAVKRGEKTFEFRKDDRDYRVGDTLRLREWKPDVKWEGGGEPVGYTGEMLHRTITYIIREGFGIPEGYCIMSIASLPIEGGTQDGKLTGEEIERIADENCSKVLGGYNGIKFGLRYARDHYLATKEEPAALRAVLEKARTVARQYHAGVQVSADTWKDLDALIKAADADL